MRLIFTVVLAMALCGAFVVSSATAQCLEHACPVTGKVHMCMGATPAECRVCAGHMAMTTGLTGPSGQIESPDGRPVFFPSEVKIYPLLGNSWGYMNYGNTSDLSAEQVWSAFVKAFQGSGHVRSGQRWLGGEYSNYGYFTFRPSESLTFREVKNPGTSDIWLVRIIAKPVGTRQESTVRGPSFLATAIGIGATIGADEIDGRSFGRRAGAAYLNQLAYSIFRFREAVQMVHQSIDVTIELENLGTRDTQVFSGQSVLATIQDDRLVENAYRSVAELNRYSLDSAVQQAMAGALTGFQARPRLNLQTELEIVLEYNRDTREDIEAERQLKAALEETRRLNAELEKARQERKKP